MSKSRSEITRHFRAFAETTGGVSLPEELEAVALTLDFLRKQGRADVIAAVEAIYLIYPTRRLRRGEISERALAFSRSYHADVSTVYRWLREARGLWRYFYDGLKNQ